jgi:hypothetical protein
MIMTVDCQFLTQNSKFIILDMSPYSKDYPTDAMLAEVMERVHKDILENSAKVQRELDRRMNEVRQHIAQNRMKK